MAYRVTLSAGQKSARRIKTDPSKAKESKKSVVNVFFSSRNLVLPYYNDQFDLQKGDYVYVSGKLSGQLGMVTEVTYCFKIRLSDYERVIAVADTKIKGEFYGVGSDFITFDSSALPYKKVLSWLKPPALFPEEYVQGSETRSFCLDDLSSMKADGRTVERARDCLADGKIKYVSVCGKHGRAIAVGREVYEIELKIDNGMISDLFCSCYHTDYCCHSVAAVFRLREILDIIENDYRTEYEKNGCFCVVDKNLFLRFSVGYKEKNKIVL
ncbi:MAG: SWIM zinc finger domain-containing protein [Acutalibacteraceae bacterium]